MNIRTQWYIQISARTQFKPINLELKDYYFTIIVRVSRLCTYDFFVPSLENISKQTDIFFSFVNHNVTIFQESVSTENPLFVLFGRVTLPNIVRSAHL